VAYFSDGNPIWFTVGKGSDDLIPTSALFYLISFILLEFI